MRRALATASTRTAAVGFATVARPVGLVPPRVRSRTFAHSSSPGFFFRRPVSPPSHIARDLAQAAEDGRADVIAKLYPALVDAFKSSSPSSSSSSAPLVTHRALRAAMRTVARSNRLALVLRMFNDLAATFGFTPTALDHHLVVKALCVNGKMLAATRWLDSMHDTYGVKPHVSDCNVILQGWRTKRDLYEMRAFVERVMRRKHNIEPNVVTYNTFISAAFEAGGKLDEVRKIVDEMQRAGVEHDRWTETALLSGYLDAGEMASAKQMQRRLAARMQGKAKAAPGGFADTAMVNTLLKYEARVHGFDHAVKLVQRWRDEQGIELDLWTLNSLLVEGAAHGSIETASDGVRLVEQLEDVVEVQADRRTWSVLINEMVKRHRQGGEGGPGATEALALYHSARDRSIEPDAAMIHPLIESLVSPRPTPESFEMAQSLYEDLSTSPHLSNDDPTTSGQPVYSLLLHACADPSILDLAYARRLITDMKRHGIKLESATSVPLIALLMRSSSSYDEAFSLYDELRALDPSILASVAAYNDTLAAFLALDFGDGAAPTELVMEFLSDMRKQSLPANPATYAILLTHYSRARSASRTVVEHLHALVKLDIHLDPDVALFNALMAAYSRVGAYDAVYRIFDSMVVNTNTNTTGGAGGGGRGVDHRSVSIVLDTCGYDRSAQAQARATRLWAAAVAEGAGPVPRPNKKNWDAWVECQCRWGHVDRAARVALDDMGTRADRETFEVLIKFARAIGGEKKWSEIRERVFAARPELSESLGEVGAAKTSARSIAGEEER
ncbi:hypothetical protein JCM11491_002204 [Sporobolomyces phaffii]